MGHHTDHDHSPACPECGTPFENRALPPGTELRCGRCGIPLKKASGLHSLQPACAFSTLGLILVIWANIQPVLTFSVAGNSQSSWIATGVAGLFSQGYGPVGALVFFSAIAAPALHLASMWYVSAACCTGLRWPGVETANRLAEWLEPWNLVPVFAVGCVVAVVKLDMLGTVTWQSGALWVLALSLCSMTATSCFKRELVEESLEAFA